MGWLRQLPRPLSREAAQALGDFLSLSKRNRRAIRLHLGADVVAGLRRLQQAIEKAV